MRQVVLYYKIGFQEGVHTLGFGRSWCFEVSGSVSGFRVRRDRGGPDIRGRTCRVVPEILGPSGRSCRRADLVDSSNRVSLGVRDAGLGVPQRSACRISGDLGVLPVRVLANLAVLRVRVRVLVGS